jgi:hypothetical protein
MVRRTGPFGMILILNLFSAVSPAASAASMPASTIFNPAATAALPGIVPDGQRLGRSAERGDGDPLRHARLPRAVREALARRLTDGRFATVRSHEAGAASGGAEAQQEAVPGDRG